MGNAHKIFSNGQISNSDKNVVQKVKYNRQQLLSKEVAKELNTYLNFGVFPTFADTFVPYYENGQQVDAASVGKDVKAGVGTPGVRSLFNRAGAVIIGSNDGNFNVDIANGETAHSFRIANNVPLMDSPAARRRIRKSAGCSVKELVEASSRGEMGQETYAYSDFMYCKHLGKVSNNYMITLRRFPLPVDDYIGAREELGPDREANASKNASCIGCMVTWMGVSGNDMSNILKYSFNMPFKFQTAETHQENKQDADSHSSMLNSIFSVFDKQYQQQYIAGYNDVAANTAFKAFGSAMGGKSVIGKAFGMAGEGDALYKEYAKFRDQNKVYGPIDSIRSTYARSEDGLTFEHKISLVFEYELRSYNGINPKQAMLDLLSNILNVTYTTGSFWGGGYKGYGAHQSNVFANLKIMQCKGGFTDFIDAFAEDLSSGVNALGNLNMGSIKEALNAIGGMMMAGILNKLGRPQKAIYNSLLSPAPIGFWHVTIGNPKRPIMSIGNMVITNVSVEHNGPLGLDDFPTNLKVTVELDRGKPRDIRDIEKLYMQGTDRIYSSMGPKVFDMYKNAELYKKSRTNPNSYKPVTNVANVDLNPNGATVTIEGLKTAGFNMKKYFGTDDTYSIYVPAAEQEYGAGRKKPSTKANKNLAGANK